MMKDVFSKRLHAVIIGLLVLTGISYGATIENYTAWQNEYDGSSSNTIALYNFNQDQVYSKWDGHSSDEALKGRTNTWMAYTKDNLDSAATFADGGKFGWGAHNYGGSDGTDFVRLYQSKNLFSADVDPSLTVEMWVNFSDLTQSTQYLIDKKFSDNSGFEMFLSNEGRLNFRIGDGSQTLAAFADLSWETGKFYHVAGTWDADTDTLKVFRDGVEVDSRIFEGSVLQNSTGREVRLAQRLGASYYTLDGVIDGVRISDVAYGFAVPEPATVLVLGLGALALIRKK